MSDAKPAKRQKQLSREAMYTIIRNLTRDGRDRSLDYKITGFSVPSMNPDRSRLSW